MNYSRCYEMLGLAPGCSWEELQGGYRRQVQKWHPDRYGDEPERQSLAAQRMLSINEAFGILAQYYRQFGSLPGGPPPPVVEATDAGESLVTDTAAAGPAAEGSASTPAVTHHPLWDFDLPMRPDDRFPVVHRRHDSLSAVPWIFLFALFGLGYLVLAHLIENGMSHDLARSLPTAAPVPASTQEHAAGKSVFSYGDTPGRVFEIQGVPTRTSGDLWFYGESEVYFENGVVASWRNAPSHPLRVPMDARAIPARPAKHLASP